MQICVSLFTLMAGVFVHPELVIKPGLGQLFAALLVSTSTLGITFSLQATFSDKPLVDRCARVVLAAIALATLLSVNDTVSALGCVPVLIAIGYWLVYRRRLEAGEPEVVELDAAALKPATVGGASLSDMS